MNIRCIAFYKNSKLVQLIKSSVIKTVTWLVRENRNSLYIMKADKKDEILSKKFKELNLNIQTTYL